MKRNSFLRTILSTTAMLSLPVVGWAKGMFKNRGAKGFKVAAGTDRFNESITLMEGDIFYTKVSSKDSDGDMFVFESTRFIKGGPPLHYHYTQDEWFYILEGEFIFTIGEENFTAKSGDSLFGPRMIPHAFAKINEGPAKMLITFQPAGRMEIHFKAVSESAYKNLSAEEKQQFRKNNGFEVVGPALTHEK